jgi:hypothetical protein
LEKEQDQDYKDGQEEKGPTNMEKEQHLLLTPRRRNCLPDGIKDLSRGLDIV